MKLKGKNLGERQHDFNTKVNDAVKKKIDFPAIRDDPVDSDIDQLFKIDIASRLKDVRFLLQTLISGDSLYITRVLKSVWLFDDKYYHIVNPEFLGKNIFPEMSSKMMKKLLTTASIWIRNEERAEKFYWYCKEHSMPKIAVKFLYSTSEAFKESVLQNDFEILKDSKVDLRFVIKSSFKFAALYVSKSPKHDPLHELLFLYSVDSDKFLDMLETHYIPDIGRSHSFGLRISKDIFKRYKERILKHPRVYATALKKSSIEKYSNSEDAKIFLKAILPDGCDTFWGRYIDRFEFIIKIIPLGERHDYLKKIYHEKYESELEMNRKCYHCGYYTHMTFAQQEKWALDQLATNKEMLGAGQDYLWYKFVKFDIAFEEIKNLIIITKDDNKRTDMLCVLVRCAKNLTELEKLLNYYHEKHGSEMEDRKNDFVDCIISHHINIFSFDRNCWNTFNEILYGLDIYNAQNLGYSMNYKMIALIYPILHGMEVPEVLRCWVIDYLYKIPFKIKMKIYQYDPNGLENIYKYILQVYLDELYNLEKQEYDDEIRIKVGNLIDNVNKLRRMFHKIDSLPEIVMKYKKLNPKTYLTVKKTEEFNLVTPQKIMRMLKEDAFLTSDFVSLERSIQHSRRYNIKELLQKLRLYFHDDIAQQYLEYFKTAYKKEGCKLIYASVLGIFLLANEKFKTEFILQHAPQDAKIQFDEINRNEFYIQEAICRFACYSRPPIRIDYILKYMKGDYVKYCLPMLNVYMTRHTPAIRMKFVKCLLNTPVSIQKHGIRLAFQCLKIEELVDLVLKSWQEYRNVSLRMVIYEYVFNSVKNCESTRKELFEILKKITLDLKEDDCEEVMKIALQFAELPFEIKGPFLEAVWSAISTFSDSKFNLNTKAGIISAITKDFDNISKESVKKVVTTHIESPLFMNNVVPNEERSDDDGTTVGENYDEVAWTLTLAFICEYCNDEDTLELVRYIIQMYVKRWNDTYIETRLLQHVSSCVSFHFYECRKPVHVYQKFCFDFIKSLIDRSYCSNKRVVEFNRVLESVLEYLTNSVPKHEIFVLMLNLKVVMVTNRVLHYASTTYKNCDFNEEALDDIAKEYVKEIENFVKEMTVNKSFSTAFTNFFSDVIMSNVKCMALYLSKGKHVYEKLIISIASNCVDSNMVEILLLAVALSSSLSCDETDEEWKSFNVLQNKLSKIDEGEVKYFIHVKFVEKGFSNI